MIRSPDLGHFLTPLKILVAHLLAAQYTGPLSGGWFLKAFTKNNENITNIVNVIIARIHSGDSNAIIKYG